MKLPITCFPEITEGRNFLGKVNPVRQKSHGILQVVRISPFWEEVLQFSLIIKAWMFSSIDKRS